MGKWEIRPLACSVSHDWVVGAHPQPHICNQRPQFAYSLYNFNGATMTIKGSLHCEAVFGRKLSCQSWSQKWWFSGIRGFKY